MQISHRFSIAVHTLLCIALFEKTHKVTSTFIAGSVGVHPVVIRQVLGLLKKAGLVDIRAGSGGASLLRLPSVISLRDVYAAVALPTTGTSTSPGPKGSIAPVAEGAVTHGNELFNFHKQPNPACPVGRNIHAALNGHLHAAHSAMEDYLAKVTLSSLLDAIR